MSKDYARMLADLDAGTLAPEAFGHGDHVAVAWQALREAEFFAATKRIADGLRRLTEAAGVPEKYNATLTLAFMSLIAERMGEEDDAESFRAAHPELARAGFVEALYAGVDLRGALARRVGLLPISRAR